VARQPASLGQQAHLRLTKSTPGWMTPSLCKPEQRTAGPGLLPPPTPSYGWPAAGSLFFGSPGERPAIPNDSTQRARGGFRRLRATIGTPASPPKHSQVKPGPKGTGRPPRAAIHRSRERHEVVVSVQLQAQGSCRAWWPPKSFCPSDGYLSRCSMNIRTARSPTSGESRVPWALLPPPKGNGTFAGPRSSMSRVGATCRWTGDTIR